MIVKSLPTSLFQREEKDFPLWKRGMEGDLSLPIAKEVQY
jgi:hypothetical protein